MRPAWIVTSLVIAGCRFPELPPITEDAGGDAAGTDGDTADGAPCEGEQYGFAISSIPACEVPVASGPLDLGSVVRIDTTAGTLTTAGSTTTPLPSTRLVAQSGGPMVRVVAATSLSTGPADQLQVVGDYPIAFLVRGDVTLAGQVAVTAGRSAPCTPGSGTAGTGTLGGGGGGGALGAAGGAGGRGGGGINAGEPGLPLSPPTIAPLRGGCPGSPGSNATPGGAVGGAGGGAIQISATGTITVDGILSASGGGGGAQPESGGGGGGSGGVIVLEAGTQIAGTGALTSNGGAGGGGGEGAGGNSPTAGQPGQSESALCAIGGNRAGTQSGYGGNGGCRTSPGGLAGTSGGAGAGGGGGGGTGIIWLRSRLTTFGGVASPAVSTVTI